MAEQLVEVSLEVVARLRLLELIADIPALRDPIELEVFTVFTQDRAIPLLRSRSLTIQFHVVALMNVFKVLPGQSSAASSEQTVHIPVPHGGRHYLHPPSAADFSNPPDTADQGGGERGVRTLPRYKKSAKIQRTQLCESAPGVELVASMSLVGVLACFVANGMGCDYFFWSLQAEWFGWFVALLGLPSCPVIQKLSLVWTEHGVVFTRQSTDASGKNSVCVACSHMEWAVRARPSYLAVMSLCLGFACGVQLDFPGDAWDAMLSSTVDGFSVVSGCCGVRLDLRGDATRNSWFDSGYMFCVSFERFFDEFQKGEVCSADASDYGLFWRCAHIQIWTLFLRRSVADSGFDDFLLHFCSMFRAPLRS